MLPDEFGTSADAGLLTIDHIALGLPTDALDTWVLFCRAVLGMRPGDSLELSDPNGLIRSAGMASPNGGVRFVLNVSLSQRTHTARTIDTSRRTKRPTHWHRLLQYHPDGIELACGGRRIRPDFPQLL